MSPNLTYLGPQKEGHPPWEKPLWLQQLPGPPESVGPVGEEVGVRDLTQCSPTAMDGSPWKVKGFILYTVYGAGYLSIFRA